MIRLLIQLLTCACVATLLAQGIGLGFLWTTGKIDQGKLLKMLAVLHDVNVSGPASGGSTQPPVVDSEQVSFEDIERRRALESLYLETKSVAIDKGLQEVRLERDSLAEDEQRLKQLQAGFDQSLANLAQQAQLDGIEKQRQIWTKIEPDLAKDQIMEMIEADEIDDVVVLLSDMPAASQAKIIGEFSLTDAKERDAVDEILRKIRKGLPATALIEKARGERPATPP